MFMLTAAVLLAVPPSFLNFARPACLCVGGAVDPALSAAKLIHPSQLGPRTLMAAH